MRRIFIDTFSMKRIKIAAILLTLLGTGINYKASAQEKNTQSTSQQATDSEKDKNDNNEEDSDGEVVKEKKKRRGSLYFAWGYNQEWYTRSTIHINQPDFNSEYELVSVKGHDHMGWNNKSIFKQPISIPQYSYRIGYFFNEKQDMGFEINFEHTKYIIQNNQRVDIRGRVNGVDVNRDILFSEDSGFYYFLNNGANFLLFNFVKRWGIYRDKGNNLALDFLGKAGVGPVIPHVENKLFGVANDPHFQFGGWNVGIETAVRATFLKYGYLEFAQKFDYARYSNLKIAGGGTAKHNFGSYILILTAGFILPTTKQHPWFSSPSTTK